MRVDVAVIGAGIQGSSLALRLAQPGPNGPALDETHAKVPAGRGEKMLRHGLPVEVLDGNAVRRLEPAISPSARGALFFPDEASVDPRLLARAVYVAAARAGATFLTGQVKRIGVEGGRATAADHAQGRIEADRVVLPARSGSLPAH